MKKFMLFLNLMVILTLVVSTSGCSRENHTAESTVLSDWFIFEDDTSHFNLQVYFTDDSMNTIKVCLVDSIYFSVTNPDPIQYSTYREIELDYSSLPLNEVTNECEIVRNNVNSKRPNHEMFILDDKYVLYQYLDKEPYKARLYWQPMYELDSETQAKILEYADYDNRENGYKFGPLYHATPEGQIQCIYKYGNKVYYRQIN
ncbi:MAG: hypothetical protein E7478_05825 [Ruminococcaceae bacterium]|nr:hypothetical protein [Oscillospiraceae bacterium]